MRYILRYNNIQGGVSATHCVEADSVEEVYELGQELYNPDGWNHTVHVKEGLPGQTVTMLMDGTEVPKKQIKKQPGRQLEIQHVHAPIGDDRPY